MPELYDNLFLSPESILRSGERDQTELIRSLLNRSGGTAQSGGGLGLPFSGPPVSGMPKFNVAPILTAGFQQQQARGPAPDMPFMPAPVPAPMERIKMGESIGMDAFENAFQKGPTKASAKDDDLKKIRDALAASQNVLAEYARQDAAGVPNLGSRISASANPKSKRVYSPMQAPDTGEEMPPEMALEQYRYNLGNIRSSNIDWQGKTSPYQGFESFVSPEQGARAMYLNLRSYSKDPTMTLGSAIRRWAPETENNTKSYINYVVENSKLPPGTPLRDILSDPQKAAAMMYWMGKMEHGGDLPKVFTPEFLAKVVSGVQ